MPKTKLGKVSISPKGEWSKTAVYEQLDLVTYNGGSWLCTFPNTAQAPAKGEYWTQIAAKGDTGAAASLKVEATDTGATVTATDASGTTSANLVNGGTTADGIAAALGYTPQKKLSVVSYNGQIVNLFPDKITVQINNMSVYGCVAHLLYQFIVNETIKKDTYGFNVITLPVAPRDRIWIGYRNDFYCEAGSKNIVCYNGGTLSAAAYHLEATFIADN